METDRASAGCVVQRQQVARRRAFAGVLLRRRLYEILALHEQLQSHRNFPRFFKMKALGRQPASSCARVRFEHDCRSARYGSMCVAHARSQYPAAGRAAVFNINRSIYNLLEEILRQSLTWSNGYAQFGARIAA